MRILIDGYNLMYAAGALTHRIGPNQFMKVRDRFLKKLATKIDPIDAHQTTIVFDATNAPTYEGGFPPSYKGIRIVYATQSASADEYIEDLIAKHSNPQQLTVVSTDNRIKLAAKRRKAKALTSDEYLDQLDQRQAMLQRKQQFQIAPPAQKIPQTDQERARIFGLSSAETKFWLKEFGELEDLPEAKEVLANGSAMINDDEIDRIAREVEAEFGKLQGKPSQFPRRSRGK